MMRLTACFLMCAVASSASVGDVATTKGVTSMEKVIQLLTNLRSQVASEGRTEAASYTKFAKWCKTATARESKDITEGNDKIKLESANMGTASSDTDTENSDNTKRKSKKEELQGNLARDNAACKTDKATYERNAADQSKAVRSLKAAIKSMTDSSKAAASLIQVQEALTMSSVREAVVEKTGVDPKDAAFKFHSTDIIELCTGLQTDFEAKKQALDKAWTARRLSCAALKTATEQSIADETTAIAKNGQDIQKLKTDMANARRKLVLAHSELKDDALYMKDITESCEERAKDWDQRTQQRKGELAALDGALSALTGAGRTGYVSPSSADTKKQALAATKAITKVAKLVEVHDVEDVEDDSSVLAPDVNIEDTDADAAAKDSEEISEETVAADVTDKNGETAAAEAVEADETRDLPGLIQVHLRGLAPEKRLESVLAALQTSGRHIGSLTLSSLSVRARGSPFKKVKNLIQDLMERLLKESEAEVSKKGYCDKNLAETDHTIQDLFEQVNDVSTSTGANEANIDALKASINKLTLALSANKKTQDDATTARTESKGENIAAIALANAGLAGTKEASQTLSKYYADAAGASALLQGPVTEVAASETDLGFKGNYKGAQASSSAIVGLLETLISDFEEQIRSTKASEDNQQRAFVKLMQGSVSESAGKNTAKTLDEEDLKTAKVNNEALYDRLKATMSLLDTSLRFKASLKPTCIDTGMSYKERVAKREQEIKALEQGLRDLAA